MKKETDPTIKKLRHRKNQVFAALIIFNILVLIFFLRLIIPTVEMTFRPVPEELFTGEYVLADVLEKRTYFSRGTAHLSSYCFKAESGENFIIEFVDTVEEFEAGKTYSLSYSKELFGNVIYTASDGENTIISEADQIARRKSLKEGFPELLIMVLISFIALVSVTNISAAVIIKKEFKEINQKVNLRRKRMARARKN